MKLGDAFSDQIRSESTSGRRAKDDLGQDFMGFEVWKRDIYEEETISSWRLVPIFILFFAMMLLLLGKLFSLAIVHGETNRSLSDGNRIRVKVIHASRGVIYDRNGTPLVRNVPGFILKIKDSKCVSSSGFDPGESCFSYKPITRDEAIEIEARGASGSAELETVVEREYVEPEVFSHILGYTGEVTEEELKNPKLDARGYKIGDQIGRAGVEAAFDDVLAGKDGAQLVEVDARGLTLRVIRQVEPTPGRDIRLSIDSSLQKSMYDSFVNLTKLATNYYGGKVRGAAVASSPLTGEVLGLLSFPSFDSNLFTVEKDRQDDILKLLNDKENMPMFNRVLSGTYPPGSTFKQVVAAAGLESGKIKKDTEIEDVGVIEIGVFKFPNWLFLKSGARDGFLNVVGAIKRSNDIFFYKVGEFLGVSGITEWAQKFGIGRPLGIDLPGEAGGILPTPLWRKKIRGEDWYLGDTYHLAIGQGDLLVTPLQVNFWTNTIANGGTVLTPTVLKVEKKNTSSSTRPVKILKEETVSLIHEGMRQACSVGGTGWPLFNFSIASASGKMNIKVDGKNYIDAGGGKVEIPVACKTGTAEYGDPKNRTHAWFTTFAPVYDPNIVLTVLVEGGGEGSDVAAPLAKKMLEAWFSK